MKRTFVSEALRPQGFALVVTLTLMVLLAILAIGLLSLSTVSLRASSLNSASEAAKGNARMALVLALGQLQAMAGPDQRITVPAALTDSNNASGFTGVWRAWTREEQGKTYDKDPRFLGWFMQVPATEALRLQPVVETIPLRLAGNPRSAAILMRKIRVAKSMPRFSAVFCLATDRQRIWKPGPIKIQISCDSDVFSSGDDGGSPARQVHQGELRKAREWE